LAINCHWQLIGAKDDQLLGFDPALRIVIQADRDPLVIGRTPNRGQCGAGNQVAYKIALWRIIKIGTLRTSHGQFALCRLGKERDWGKWCQNW